MLHALILLGPGKPSLPKVESTAAVFNSIKLIVGTPPERDCGPITDYFVRSSSQSKLTSSYSVNNGNVTILITGLVVGRQYEVRISAINNRSWESPPSELITFHTGKGEIITSFTPIQGYFRCILFSSFINIDGQ